MYAPRRSSGEKSSSLSRSLPRNPLPTSLSRCPRGTRVGRARDVVRARVLVSARARARGSGSFPAGRLAHRPAPPPACAPWCRRFSAAHAPSPRAGRRARRARRGHRPRDPRLLETRPARRAPARGVRAPRRLGRPPARRRAAIRDRRPRPPPSNARDESRRRGDPPLLPRPSARGSWFADLFGGPPPRESSAARRDQNQPHAGGVYLHGGPGCGKTFCMDLAYACLPGAPGVGKRREHFHSFMLETHVKLHELGKLSKGAGTRDTVATYAREVARDARVLCLDEFQVTDVADAMIIRRLLDQLWARGVTLVTTSNRAPTDLYKNGLNRPQFVPCIEAIEARCDVHEMRSDVDYRLTGHALVGAEEEEEEEDDAETNTSRRRVFLGRSSHDVEGDRLLRPRGAREGGRVALAAVRAPGEGREDGARGGGSGGPPRGRRQGGRRRRAPPVRRRLRVGAGRGRLHRARLRVPHRRPRRRAPHDDGARGPHAPVHHLRRRHVRAQGEAHRHRAVRAERPLRRGDEGGGRGGGGGSRGEGGGGFFIRGGRRF